jgi:hypothetical protein
VTASLEWWEKKTLGWEIHLMDPTLIFRIDQVNEGNGEGKRRQIKERRKRRCETKIPPKEYKGVDKGLSV